MILVFRPFVLVVVALSVLTLAVPASAQTEIDCASQIDALSDATSSATFSGKNAVKDEDGLVAKLGSATEKLEQGKGDNAITALTQYRDKVADLSDEGKIDSGDAADLIEGADDVIACLQQPAA